MGAIRHLEFHEISEFQPLLGLRRPIMHQGIKFQHNNTIGQCTGKLGSVYDFANSPRKPDLSSERPNPTRPIANCLGLEIFRRVLNKDCKYHVAFDDLVSSKRQFVAVDGKKSKSTGNKSPLVSVRRSTVCVYINYMQ